LWRFFQLQNFNSFIAAEVEYPYQYSIVWNYTKSYITRNPGADKHWKVVVLDYSSSVHEFIIYDQSTVDGSHPQISFSSSDPPAGPVVFTFRSQTQLSPSMVSVTSNYKEIWYNPNENRVYEYNGGEQSELFFIDHQELFTKVYNSMNFALNSTSSMWSSNVSLYFFKVIDLI
jgi:hypothetical protein